MSIYVKVYADLNAPMDFDSEFSKGYDVEFACEGKDTASSYMLIKPHPTTWLSSLESCLMLLEEAGHRPELIIK